MTSAPHPLFDQQGPLSVAYIVRSYPRLSQTFILDEIVMLERMGMKLRIFAVTDPKEAIVQSEVEEVQAPAHYFDQSVRRNRPVNVMEHLVTAIRAPRRYVKALRLVWSQKSANGGYTASSRYECFLYAVNLAALLQRERRRTGVRTAHLHAHFAHDPTLIAMLAHVLTGISYSFTAHARDLYQVPESVLQERAERASAIVTCCRANVDYLKRALPPALSQKVRLIYHGKDLPAAPVGKPNPATPASMIMSVGRLVEKKGFGDLLLACHELKQRGQPFSCVIYGDGPQRSKLHAMVRELGLSEHVSLEGARSRKEILSAYGRADLFALTPFVPEDGDRDGIPNVLIEAMAYGLPVVTTAVGGIPEVVKHDENGLLAAPRDVDEIAAHLASVVGDRERRKRLALAARNTVEQDFDARKSARQLVELFEGLIWGSSRLQPA